MTRRSDIVFDLDDTLLDTSATLLPLALNDIERTLASWGISVDPNWREKRSSEWLHALTRTHSLNAQQFRTLERLFFHRAEILDRLPHDMFLLRPSPDALLEALNQAMQEVSLTLLTAGDRQTQLIKLAKTGLDRLPWANIIVVERPQDKAAAFSSLVSEGLPMWAVGNRYSTDLAPAVALGARTCLIRHGEHLNESVGEIAVDAVCDDAVQFLRNVWC